MFYDDCASPEELIALRFNKCFSVVPEDKRTLMENFQNWQPRVQFQRIEIESSEPCKNESPKIEPVEETGIFTYVTATEIDENVYDEIIVEEDFSSTEALEQELIKADIERQATMEIDPPGPKSLKPSEDQRKWANKTIKTCYSIKQSEDGVIVPIWTCSECDKVYSSAQAIRHHLLAKHKNSNEENHQLNDEIREWIRNEHRERRTIIETADDGNKFEWACNSCKFTCNAGQTFRSHLIETHIKNNKPPVTDSSEKTLNYHQQQWIQSQIKHESIENGWKCMKCDEDFKSEKLLRQHLFYHALNLTTDDFRVAKTTGGRPRKSKSVKFQWTCKDCWFQFSAQRSFDAHMKLHETLHCMNPYTVLHRCEECKMFFREVDDLISHIEGHAEGQSLLVPATGIALQKTILFKRLPIPLDAQEGDSSCGHCGRKLFGDNNCKNHLLIHHVNPLVCPKDGRPFSSMQPYICHLQKVHPEIFPESLNCTHCKLPFDNIYERLAHMKLCDEKKFHCDHCDKKFSNKNYLNSHLKRELGLLSVQCTICDKILKAKDELKIHMRKHTKEVRKIKLKIQFACITSYPSSDHTNAPSATSATQQRQLEPLTWRPTKTLSSNATFAR